MDNQKSLAILNLSENLISKIENISHLPILDSLIIERNKIGCHGSSDWMQLAGTKLSALDISNNRIDSEDPEDFLQVLKSMKNLRVLYLNNNPICSKIKNYRKRLISELSNLRYLGNHFLTVNIIVRRQTSF